MTSEQATAFADQWVAAWNAHDLAAILAHYTDDFEMTTPYIVSLMNDPSGTLKGKVAIGAYWSKALAAYPDLHFELEQVYASVNAVAIAYRSIGGRKALEVFFFNDEGRVHKAIAHYA
jgi:ketosteroid isomerase-like protein